jgi:hypothetical protein
MNLASIKSIAIKVLLALVTLVILYSVFWFFKIGQFEKQINRFVGDNSSNVSIGGFEVSGFPFSQKVTISNLRFSLPTAALNHHQIIVSGLEISGGIFDSVFDVNITGNVLVQDQKGGSFSLSFNSKPQIKIAVLDGFLSSFSYQDNGHKVVDGAKNVIYSAASSSVTVDSTHSSDGKIIFTISSNVKEVENFGILNIYKNAFEGKLIDAIKTGQVAIVDNQVEPSLDPNAVAAPVAVEGAPAAVAVPAPAIAPAPESAATAAANKVNAAQMPEVKAAPAKPEIAAPTSVKNAPQVAANTNDASVQKAAPLPANVAPAKSEAAPAVAMPLPVAADNKKPEAEKAANQVAAPVAVKPADAANEVVDNNASTIVNQALEVVAAPSVKSSFSLTAQYILSPGASNQLVPVNVAQMQENTSQYSKSLKITNFSITNSLYTISINGEINMLPDDTMPSGGISLRIEKFSDAISYAIEAINKISHKAFSDAVNEALPINEAAQSSTSPEAGATPSPAVENAQSMVQDFANDEAYHNFLNRISPNFADIVKQVAAKNPVSKEEVAQFDIRREKNLEFLVNETPMREILGKF